MPKSKRKSSIKRKRKSESLESADTFDGKQLKLFLRNNNLSMFVRSEARLAPKQSCRINAAGKMITLTALGSLEMSRTTTSKAGAAVAAEKSGTANKAGTVAYCNRFNLRLLNLELEM